MQRHQHPWALYLGHMLECIDNTLYGFLAVVLAPVFFLSTSHESAVIESLGAFAVGFLSRPFGALFFGWMGDRFGRKKPLYWSLLFVGIPTIGIGLTPSYSDIGVFASVMLIVFRFVQGFLWGGEFAGANIYIAENKNKERLGAKISTLTFTGAGGAVIASFLGALFMSGNMPMWGWRIPFLMGGACTFLVFLYRRKIIETADFIESGVKHHVTPVRELFSHYKFPLLLTILLTGMDMMPVYFACVYGNTFYGELGLTASQSILLNGATFALTGCLILLSGRLADRIGAQRQIIISLCVSTLLSIPFFSFIDGNSIQFYKIVLFAIGLPCTGILLNSVYLLYAVPLFPVHCRYSGIALGVTAGQALFAGTAPLIGKVLAQFFDTRLAPGVWLSSIAFLTLLCVLYNKKRVKK